MFLEISQNSHENTCTRISFLIKLQASVSNFIKKEAQVFSCEFCEFFKNTFSYRARPECFWNKTSGYLNKRLWNRCFLLNVAIFLRNLFYPIITCRPICVYSQSKQYMLSCSLLWKWNFVTLLTLVSSRVILLWLDNTWIIIQTHIRNTDTYSDTDSENLHISHSNQWFSLNVIKVSQRVANDKIIDGKTSLQKSVILPIIRGVSPT